jgi:signal transduction histidine kinase
LLIIGVGGAGYLVSHGTHAKDWSVEDRRDTGPTDDFIDAVQQERRLTLLKIAGDRLGSTGLAAQRARTDLTLRAIASAADSFEKIDPVSMHAAIATLGAQIQEISSVRQQVDSGAMTIQDAYSFYSQVVGNAVSAVKIIVHKIPDLDAAVQGVTASELAQVAEAMSKGSALAAAAVAAGNGLSPIQFKEFGADVGLYHSEWDSLMTELPAQAQGRAQALIAGAAWRQLSSVEDSIIRHGAGDQSISASLPLNTAQWRAAAAEVNSELLAMWRGQEEYAMQVAADAGDRTARNSLLGGGAVLLVSVLAFLVALRISSGLVGRLRRLRRETLAMADERLPAIMSRLREGQSVDLDAEVAQLDFGRDEIGQVAEAFNRAQFAALSAAAAEAKTRNGANAVFLNIAYRSQLLVHRQLDLLDKAERAQEDPAALNMLFSVDHLATRERRNAENLIILGGGQPGRQWRNAVRLMEVVRSAIAETEDFARVRMARLPAKSIVGNAIADLIHLLAELVDNATSFSPPGSRIEVTGNVVGRGLAVEVTDQGIGMTPADITRVNETLRTPGDFSLGTLSSDPRLGMFVVARLAARHGIGVRLTESAYGGIRVIVVIPSSLIADEATVLDAATSDEDTLQRRSERFARTRFAREGGGEMAERPRLAVLSADSPEPPDHSGYPQYARSESGVGLEERADGARPELPRRRRRENPAPRPAKSAVEQPVGQVTRSAEQARALFSAIEDGVRRGRRDPTDFDPENPYPDTREGH